MEDAGTRTGGGASVRVGVFVLALAFASSPWSNPPIALAVGIVIALAGLGVFEKQGKVISKALIQACVVLLGLRVDLREVLHGAAEGAWLAVGTIVGTLLLGAAVGRLLRIERDTSLLVSSGTAICGGSAIAAVGSAIGATGSALAVATGAVFILNAVALYAFPPLGKAIGLSATQFGTWCGVAVHDMSSVNGAARQFGPEAMDTANVVKLTRVLWIAPIAMIAGWMRRHGRVRAAGIVPWFIVLFIIASAVRTWWPAVGEYAATIGTIAGHGFQAALFLIGAAISRRALREVGWKAIVLALALWIAVAGVSLVVIRETVG